ncbi:MAG: hypothetical protein AAGK14_10165 [Verrucomicrobiota bacterium]
MSEPKTRCPRCGVEFLQATANRTGGLCMPCVQELEREAAFANPLPYSCHIGGLDRAGDQAYQAVAHTTVQELLEESESRRRKDQAVLLGAFRVRKPLHWAILTRRAPEIPPEGQEHVEACALSLFDQGKAELEVAGLRYRHTDLVKRGLEDSTNGTQARAGGWEYRDAQGKLVFKVTTAST